MVTLYKWRGKGGRGLDCLLLWPGLKLPTLFLLQKNISFMYAPATKKFWFEIKSFFLYHCLRRVCPSWLCLDWGSHAMFGDLISCKNYDMKQPNYHREHESRHCFCSCFCQVVVLVVVYDNLDRRGRSWSIGKSPFLH